MKDYRRLKMDENSHLFLNWNLNREISKLNCHIHTNVIKTNLIPSEITPEQISFTYASEADLLNIALFGKTARQWRDKNADKKGNIRDDVILNQLLVLANMESYNVILIEQGKRQPGRLIALCGSAVRQMQTMKVRIHITQKAGRYEKMSDLFAWIVGKGIKKIATNF